MAALFICVPLAATIVPRCRRVCFPTTGHGEWLRTLLIDPPARGRVIVGEVGGQLHVVAGYRHLMDAAGRAEVALAVAPGFEGRGIGTRVLEVLAEQARAEGIVAFDAWVPRDDRRVIDLFASSGFDVGQHDDRRPDVLRVSLGLAHAGFPGSERSESTGGRIRLHEAVLRARRSGRDRREPGARTDRE